MKRPIVDRWVMCDQCGAVLGERAEATSVRCEACNVDVPLPPRDDSPLAVGAAVEEVERIRRLREQDGRPLQAPPGLDGLLHGGSLPAYKEREAIELYLTDRRTLRKSSDPAAQERLMFLTLLLAKHFDDPVRRRALFETSLDAVTLKRHQQNLRGLLARSADSPEIAEAWLAPCDARSDDLDMDTAWRLSRAHVDLQRGNWRGMLDVLGDTADDVPIADHSDALSIVYRAHAHEQLGDVKRAADQLSEAMASGKRRVIASILDQRKLCPQSIARAEAKHREMAAARARSMAGGGVGVVLIGSGLLMGGSGAVMFVVGVGLLVTGGTEEAMGLLCGGSVMAVVGVVVLGGLGLGQVTAAKRNARILLHGKDATGVVLSAEPTGTEINDVPMMRIRMRIQMEGKSPWEASTTLLVGPQNNAMLTPGCQLYVRVDPDDPSQVVIDSG